MGQTRCAVTSEMQPGLNTVFVSADDGHAEGFYAAGLFAHEIHNQFQVVNHQIVDDSNIGGAERVGAHSFGANVFGFATAGLQFLKSGIEPLDVTNLKRQPL